MNKQLTTTGHSVPTRYQPVNEQMLSDSDLAKVDLSKSTPVGLDLVGEYWKPIEIGEAKKVFFLGFCVESFPDQKTGELLEHTCVVLVEPGSPMKVWTQAGAQLVGAFKKLGQAALRQPFRVTFSGIKTLANSHKMNKWAVEALVINGSTN